MKIQSLASDKRKPNIFFSTEKKKERKKDCVAFTSRTNKMKGEKKLSPNYLRCKIL